MRAVRARMRAVLGWLFVSASLLTEGANPKEIQEWVGHASIEETMDTYGHLFPNAKHQLSSMLDSYAKRHNEVTPLSLAN
jgi:integrase